ncbi:hypothetical protein V1477_021203 [Vespula maculifrons]|uniref:Uncharacterized protein n=1 Tax=Vespula maculifrons TaxID=7453 RepID=A0ABD2AGF6_VESMC
MSELNEGVSSSNSPEVLQRSRIERYVNPNYVQRRYMDFNYAQLLHLNGKSINAVFYDGDESISTDKWDIRSLDSSYPIGTFSAYKLRTHTFFN